MKGSAAFFIDRDGTVMIDQHYPSNAEQVQLIDGAAPAIARLNALNVPVVLVTNQSGIGRGLVTMKQYEAVHARLIELLNAEGARVDATYFCPHFPERDGPCECRKPGLGMYRKAAGALSLDLAASAFVGDRWRDVEPGVKSEGLAVLVPSRATPAEELEHARREAMVVDSLGEAVDEAIRWWAER